MSIKVNNVTKIYGEQKALNDVSFEVGSGEVVGFLGPNGAGKSTMMKILTCFIPKTSGSVSVCGYDVEEESLKVKVNVGYKSGMCASWFGRRPVGTRSPP